MVLQQKVSSTKKLRKWQTGYVWLLWRFRGFVKLEEQARKTKDKGMERHWWDKRTHISTKLQEHEQDAPKEVRIEEFTQIALKMINNGVPPKQILEELGIRKKQKG